VKIAVDKLIGNLDAQCDPVSAEAQPDPETRAASDGFCGSLGEFKTVVQHSFLKLEDFSDTWDAAVAELGGSVYMSYDWSRTWWEFYGRNKELRIFLCYAGERIVAIVPMYIDRLGWGPFRCSIGKLVGANIPPKVFNPPMHPDYAGVVLIAILEQLFVRDECDLVSLGPMSELHGPSQILEGATKGGQPRVGASRTVSGVHSIFWLPRSMDEYYASLSKNERKNRRKYELRLLRKEYDTRVEAVRDPGEVEAEFEEFVRQHTLHWNVQGKPGHFKAWPKATEFNRALVKAHASKGRLRFIKIVANGEAVANQYVFVFGKSYFWELPARAVGAQWERFSLGPTGIVTMIETAINEGMSRLEGGLAHYEYKVRLNAKEYATKTFRFVRRGTSSRVRATFVDFLRFCLGVCYHRIWYKRLRGYFPAFRDRPQWGAWLRLDF
jgi:hypothetical protein